MRILKRRKLFTTIVVLLLICCFSLCNYSYAATTTKSKTWDNTNGNMGSWVPKTGKMVVKTYTENGKYKVKTQVTMTLSSSNVSSIKRYNSGTSTNVHELCQGKKTYLTCDVTAKKESNASYIGDNMHATYITSNLPNPKYDLENDNSNVDVYKEESETVALGTVAAKGYNMITEWDDKRGANGLYGGRFLCQFSMSKKGVSDYNTVIVANGVQADIEYNNKRGEL